MGIKDLLRFIRPYIVPIHIKKYSGKRVGIDAYSWLHKGAYSCSMELALDSKSGKARQYLNYFMHRINLLRHCEITPVVVFDGGYLPCKSATESERRRRRDANLAIAKEKLKGSNVNAAIEFFQKAVHITPTMAYQLIQILKSENVEFVVAPYEADAQLAYMTSLESDEGGIAAVITEDSDLLAYGCQSVIFKMDRYGNGEEIMMDNVFSSVMDGLSFKTFDMELFTGMCVLAGCDFLPSVPGIGIKRAYSLVSKYRNLDRALSILKFDKKNQMPDNYTTSFSKALAVFHHARIYDIKTKTLKLMKPLPEKLLQHLNEDLDVLGPDVTPAVAVAIAEGILDPITLKAFDKLSKDDALVYRAPVQTLTHTRTEESLMSMQRSCFELFSSNKMSEKKTTSTLDKSLGNIKYSKEAFALGKLILPVKNKETEKEVLGRREAPNNNPFKRRKLEDEDSNGGKTTEDISVVTETEGSDLILYDSPESQKSVNSNPETILRVRQAINDKNSKTKNTFKPSLNKKSSIFNFFSRMAS